jgi:hypothetical protein
MERSIASLPADEVNLVVTEGASDGLLIGGQHFEGLRREEVSDDVDALQQYVLFRNSSAEAAEVPRFEA